MATGPARSSSPIASAVGLGLFWLGLALSALVAIKSGGVPVTVPPLWMLLEMPLIVAGTFTGGVLRVATQSDSPATAPQETET